MKNVKKSDVIEDGSNDRPKFAIKRRLAMPQLKLELETPYFIEVSGEIVEKILEAEKQAMRIVPVINLETGENNQLIVDQIVFEALKTFKDGYVGKRLQIIRHKKVQAGKGNSYYPYTINELE